MGLHAFIYWQVMPATSNNLCHTLSNPFITNWYLSKLLGGRQRDSLLRSLLGAFERAGHARNREEASFF